MPIILTVLGFLWWWPIGLVLLGLFLGRGKFGCRRPLSYAGDAPMLDGDRGRDRWERKMTRLQEKMEMVRAKAGPLQEAAATGSARRRAATAPSTTIARRRSSASKRSSGSSRIFLPGCASPGTAPSSISS